jgi:hypothetical protein
VLGAPSTASPRSAVVSRIASCVSGAAVADLRSRRPLGALQLPLGAEA